MKHSLKSFLCATLWLPLAALHSPVRAHGSEASALSVALPVAVVASAGYGASVAAAGVVALPVALSVAGATLVVKSVEASAIGVVCVLERASDGARVSLDIAGRSAATVGMSVGTALSVTMMASGAIIVSAGEAIAFVPNALGRALTHNERF
jgi:hypothetical protein